MYKDIWNDKPVRIRRSLTSTVCGVCREPGCQPYDGNIARWYILLGFDWGGLRCPILCVGSDRLFILWYPDFGQQKSNRMRYTAFLRTKIEYGIESHVKTAHVGRRCDEEIRWESGAVPASVCAGVCHLWREPVIGGETLRRRNDRRRSRNASPMREPEDRRWLNVDVL